MRNSEIHLKCYLFYYNQKKEIPIEEKVTLNDIFHKGEVDFIEQERKEEKKDFKGMLIKYKEKIYYIFDYDKKYFHTFLAYFSHEKTQNMEMLFIKKGQFFTKFQVQLISKRVKYTILRKASRLEIDYNLGLVKMNQKERISAKKHMIAKDEKYEKKLAFFRPMMIVTYLPNKKNYVILNIENNKAELVNINYCGDSFEYRLEKNLPFRYYDIMDKREFMIYEEKIKRIKEKW